MTNYPGYEVDDFYKLNQKETKMKNGIGKLVLENINSALVYGLLMDCAYVIKVGDIFILDWRVFLNTFIMAFLASIVKNLLTTNSGSFAGLVPVIPDKK